MYSQMGNMDAFKLHLIVLLWIEMDQSHLENMLASS